MSTSVLWRHWKYKADRPLNTRSQYPDLAAMFLVFSAWESFWFGPIWGQVIKRLWDWYCFWLLQRVYNLVMVKVLSKVFTNLVVQRHYKLQQLKVGGISSQTFQLDTFYTTFIIILFYGMFSCPNHQTYDFQRCSLKFASWTTEITRLNLSIGEPHLIQQW